MSASLEEAIQFIIIKNMEIILDKISADFDIDRQKLDPYLKLHVSSQKLNPVSNGVGGDSTIVICQGKTKKGETCPNKAKPGSNFCGKHSN